MKTLVLSVLVLGTMSILGLTAGFAKPTPAQAGMVELTGAQMDAITAGRNSIY